MPKRLAVVLGAGAAHDLVPLADGRPLGTADELYRPPLTQAVFADSPVTKTILDRYPGARTLAGDIRVELQRGRPLEPTLKALASARSGPVVGQFPEIPLYLQDLFAEISRTYTNQPVNYQRLVVRLHEADFEGIAFITMNYDTLLDDVLAHHYLDGTLDGLSAYLGQHCMLVKLHGSTNWVRTLRWRQEPGRGMNAGLYLDTIRSLAQAHELADRLGELEVRDSRGVRWEGAFADPAGEAFDIHYPALSVPLGEYWPICPAPHLKRLRSFLKECQNVLIVGVSGRDQDLLSVLAESLPKDVASFTLVDEGQGAANEALSRFAQVPQLSAWTARYTDGFSTFILGGGLEQFIESCR